MSKLELMCRIATPFTPGGELDEEALRRNLGRCVEHGIGVYSGSAGIGEGHTLAPDEMRRLWRIVQEECRGKVTTVANPPDQHRAAVALEQALVAVEAGCDIVNIYSIAAWHGMRPTPKELRAYYDAILSQIRHPVALSVNPLAGPPPPPALMAEIVRKYPQVVSVNLMGVNETYLLNLKDLIERRIDYYVIFIGCQNAFALGASGLLCPEANIIPRTFRTFINLYEARDFEALGPVHAGILRTKQLFERWTPAPARWAKMAMRLLKLPGGEGGLREPYQMPDDDELELMEAGLKRLGLPEMDELLARAGLL